ncbi:MAG: peptide chain release factor N(5)-glutamine methyltransferase [Bacteroidetes bacterium]|nr:peptide chain release factor N(5)-glutamine methyltransferase [Bacteroidota bacterium]
MKNTTIRVIDLINKFKARLANIYTANEIRQIIYLLFEAYLDWAKPTVHLSYNQSLSETMATQFDQALLALISGEPIQYIIGVGWFNGVKLKVDRRVLIPRMETEELCALIQKDLTFRRSSDFSILDIGTGSGCIAINIKMNFQESVITAIDISLDALNLARENADNTKCDIIFRRINILSPFDQTMLGQFDLIVSNPPYITESEKRLMNRNVTEFEPAIALFVPDEDPLIFFRTISGFAKRHLRSQGSLYFEINEHFGRQIMEILIDLGFSQVELYNDVNGKPRIIRAISECS